MATKIGTIQTDSGIGRIYYDNADHVWYVVTRGTIEYPTEQRKVESEGLARQEMISMYGYSDVWALQEIE